MHAAAAFIHSSASTFVHINMYVCRDGEWKTLYIWYTILICNGWLKENSQLTFPSGIIETLLYSNIAAVSVGVSVLAIMPLNAMFNV